MHSAPAESGPSPRKLQVSSPRCLFAPDLLAIPKRQLLRARARLDRTIRGPVGEGRTPGGSRQANYQPFGSGAALLVVIQRSLGAVVAMRQSSRRVASSPHAIRNRKALFAISVIRARPELRGSLAGRVLCSRKPRVAKRTRPAIRAAPASAMFSAARLARPQRGRRRPTECAG